jgi:hypothetical protein
MITRQAHLVSSPASSILSLPDPSPPRPRVSLFHQLKMSGGTLFSSGLKLVQHHKGLHFAHVVPSALDLVWGPFSSPSFAVCAPRRPSKQLNLYTSYLASGWMLHHHNRQT